MIDFAKEETERARYLGAVVEATGEGLILAGEDASIKLVNRSARTLLGYSAEEIAERGLPRLFDALPDSSLEEASAQIETTGRRKDGRRIPIGLSVTRLGGIDEPLLLYRLRDLTTIQELEKKLSGFRGYFEQLVAERTDLLMESNRDLAKIAQTDPLTRLANRGHFDDVLADEYRRVTRERCPLSLILCDIDYFKAYNDCYGHVAGDQCLRDVACVLRDTFQRPADLVARYGGEEFVVVLPNCDATFAGEQARRLSARLADRGIAHAASDVRGVVTISIGVATTSPATSHCSAHALLHAADRALYQAKADGRDRVVTSCLD